MIFSAAAFFSVACNLNGVLLNGACECDVAWTGANCTELSVLPTNATSGLVDADARGVHLSTWGGSVLVDDYGTWHMWAARMVGHCGIGSWLSNSEIVHATANSPTGSYVVDSVVWPIWAHEPTVVRAPSGEFVMYWTGNNGSGVLANPGGQRVLQLQVLAEKGLLPDAQLQGAHIVVLLCRQQLLLCDLHLPPLLQQASP